MRKVTVKTCEAFTKGKSKSIGNTTTDGNELRLHGHCIARKENGVIIISDCGWQTVTTKERLNGLLATLAIPYRIYQHKFAWFVWNYLTEQKWSWNKEAVISNGHLQII